MNTYYLDNSRAVQPANNLKMKIYENIPTDLSSIADGEIVAVKDVPLSLLKPPIGFISYFQSTPDENWLLCDGSEFDTDKYPELYELLGTNVLVDGIGRYLKGGQESFVAEEASLPKISGSIGHAAGYNSEQNVSGGFSLTVNNRSAGWSGDGGNYGGVANQYVRMDYYRGNDAITNGTVLRTDAETPPEAVHLNMLPYMRAK